MAIPFTEQYIPGGFSSAGMLGFCPATALDDAKELAIVSVLPETLQIDLGLEGDFVVLM